MRPHETGPEGMGPIPHFLGQKKMDIAQKMTESMPETLAVRVRKPHFGLYEFTESVRVYGVFTSSRSMTSSKYRSLSDECCSTYAAYR